MPELPEVETVRRGIMPLAKGRTVEKVIVRCRSLRLPVDVKLAQKIRGKKIMDIRRRGKYLVFDLAGGKNRAGDNHIIAHLGMSGVFYFSDNPPSTKHEHIGLKLGNRFLIYQDPRRFGCFVLCAAPDEPPLLANLGAEPLSSAFNGKSLHSKLKGKRIPIKTALLDGRVVAGVGNIYASESLFAAKIRPQTAAGSVSKARADALAIEVKKILRRAIRAGGSTIRDYAQPSGEKGYFQMQWKVYGRDNQPCACGGTIRKIVQSNRATYYCPRCQR